MIMKESDVCSHDTQLASERTMIKHQGADPINEVDDVSRKVVDSMVDSDSLSIRLSRTSYHAKLEEPAQAHVGDTIHGEENSSMQDQPLVDTDGDNDFDSMYDVSEQGDNAAHDLEPCEAIVDGDPKDSVASSGAELQIIELYAITQKSQDSPASLHSNSDSPTLIKKMDCFAEMPTTSEDEEWDHCETQFSDVEGKILTTRGTGARQEIPHILWLASTNFQADSGG